MVQAPILQSGRSSFPYVGATGWMTKLRKLFQRSIPSRVDVDWLSSPDRFAISRKNAANLLSTLVRVGWVDREGTVLEAGRLLRLSGDAYADGMRDTARRLYGDLLDQIESASAFSLSDLDQYFVASTNVGQSGRNQMIALFRWFLREAGLSELEEKVWNGKGQLTSGSVKRDSRGKQPRPASVAKAPRTKAITVRPEDRSVKNPDSTVMEARLSVLASILRINVDGNWDQPKIDAVLGWLDRLLRGEIQVADD